MRPEGFLREDDRAILYTTSDCSGQGFVGDTNLEDAPLTTVFLSHAAVVRDLAYYAVGRTVAVPDTLYEDDPPDPECASFGVVTPRGSCCMPGGPGESTQLAPVKVVDPASFGLMPPFHVEGP